MKHIVSFSGGRTSAYLVHLMEQKRINEGLEVEYVFADTGAEHPKTYEFIESVVKHFDIKLHVIKPIVSSEFGVGIRYIATDIESMGWDLSVMKKMVSVYGNFTINRPNCTSKIKSETCDRFVRDEFGKENCYRWFGIRVDEPRRLKFLNANDDLFDGKKANPNNVKYLAEISDFEKSDILEFWSEMPFDLEIPEHLGNCVFCIKKSSKKIALAQRDEPELFAEWNDVVTGDHVRLMGADKFGTGHIYRGWLTPTKLISQFSDHSDDELRDLVYRGKNEDIGECSESCEAFSDQIDMFSEDAA